MAVVVEPWPRISSGAPALVLLALVVGGVQRPDAPAPASEPLLLAQLPEPEPAVGARGGDGWPAGGCAGEPAPPERVGVLYELEDVPLLPGSFGPRIRDRPREGVPRTRPDVTGALVPYRARLDACRRHPTWPGERVRVDARIDPWGEVSTLRARGDHHWDAALVACVEHALAGLRLVGYTPRWTEARFALDIRSDPWGIRRAPPRRPWSPSPARRHPSRACREGAERLPTDALVIDGDLRVADLEASVPYGSPVVLRSPGAKHVVDRVHENLGAYRACWASAGGGPSAGRVTLVAAFDRSGRARRVRPAAPAGAREPLVACLARALAEVWLEPSDAAVEVRVPFVLLPPSASTGPARDTADGIARRARAALDRGDAATALRHYDALVRQRPDDARACGWQAGAVEATVMLAPWSDDRVFAALDRLARRATSDRAGAACVAGASRALYRFATAPHRDAQPLRRRDLYLAAVARYRRILAVLPDLPDGDSLRFYEAEALFAVGDAFDEPARMCEAAPRYDVAARRPGMRPAWVREALYAAVVSWHRCAARQPRVPANGSPCPATTDVDRRLLAAYDAFLARASDAPERRKVQYHRAHWYFDHCDLDTAVPLFEALRHGTDDVAADAAIHSGDGG